MGEVPESTIMRGYLLRAALTRITKIAELMLERITKVITTGSSGRRAIKPTISKTVKKLSTTTNAHKILLSSISEPHDVVAAIDVDGLTGNSRAQVGREVDRRVADLAGFDIAPEWCAFSVGLEHLAESRNAASSKCLDGTSRNGVHPNLVLPQVGR